MQPILNLVEAIKNPALGAHAHASFTAQAIRTAKTGKFPASEPGLDGDTGPARELSGIRGDDGETKAEHLGGERTLAGIVARTPRRHRPPLTDTDCLCAPALAQVLRYVTWSRVRTH